MISVSGLIRIYFKWVHINSETTVIDDQLLRRLEQIFISNQQLMLGETEGSLLETDISLKFLICRSQYRGKTLKNCHWVTDPNPGPPSKTKCCCRELSEHPDPKVHDACGEEFWRLMSDRCEPPGSPHSCFCRQSREMYLRDN